MKQYIKQVNAVFLVLVGFAFFMAYGPIKWLLESTANREYYSHIVLIPLVSLYLVFQDRKLIFSETAFSFRKGIPFLLIGAILYISGQMVEPFLDHNDFTALIALAALVFVQGAFMMCFGYPAYTKALFPLLFLVFVIPIPVFIMDSLIHFLQVGSAEFTNVLLAISGVPYYRDGFLFQLVGISVEVAEQCSGIRSSLALFITATLGGYLFLTTLWKKIVLVFAALVIALFKNGIRIVALTLMGTYVDSRWLTHSSLHTDGGILFFIFALLLLFPVLYVLRKGDG